MEHYEVAILMNPDLSDKDVEKFVQETKELLAKYGAAEIGQEKIERRALAHAVKKHNEGFYAFVGFNGPPTLPEQMRTELRHREELLRLAFIRKPEAPAEPEPPAEPEREASVVLGQPAPAAEPEPAPAAEPEPAAPPEPEVKDG